MHIFFTLRFYSHQVLPDDGITLLVKDLHISTFKLGNLLTFLACLQLLIKKGLQ